jgi:DNA polymerase delta subunit 1
MEVFYRKNVIEIQDDIYKNDIDMHIIEWWAQDEEDLENEMDSEDNETDNDSGSELNKDVYTIRCFGVTKTGISITCKVTGFKPFYYIRVPSTFDRVKLHHFLNYIKSSYVLKSFNQALLVDQCRILEKKDLFGFNNNTKFKFVKLTFTNYSALTKSRYLFKKAIIIPNVVTKSTKFKLYESNFEPFMRFCHIKDILMAGWVKLPKNKYKVTQDSATTQLEISIDRKDILSLKDYKDIGNFLQASWDIEVYSHDRTFPDPKYKIKDTDGNIKYPNEIFQIATTYKYTNSKSCKDPVSANEINNDDILVKHLLTLKKCDKIDDPRVVVEECKTEKELIKRWVDTISQMDPDIFYTYNGDSFDCMYLVERSELPHINLVSSKVSGNKTVKSGYLLKKLSRMIDRQADIKKEYFSSSAYGDSEFNRVYIPGRLNYDLLIHYKRGMKKYSSYKLDYIASEVLKQNKHDVSAKEIFDYYEEGRSDKIKKIGEYCIQDTALLQRLVDKQLILTNIMQLANVTYVPIGFLTTRGQTIKVYSQVLRKARQMDFLVPHTNFNEDSYPLYIKLKEPHPFEESDLNDKPYLEINCGRSQTNLTKKMIINGKLSELVDDNTIIVLSDTELQKEFYNISLKYKNKTLTIARMWSSEDAIDDSFTGATVLEPTCGLHGDNVAVLDFASLYPTIMISRNLCYSTFVFDDKYRNIPGVNYETIKWDDRIEYKMRQTCEGVGKSGKSKGMICGKQAFFEIEGKYYCRIHDLLKKERTSDEKFQKRDVSYNYTIVQPHINENGEIVNKGVLPALLEELYAERKNVKKQMAKAAAEGNKLLESILDSTQLAIKVSLNSTYGFLGRGQGNLILKELGSIVTSVGRMLIEQSKEYAEGPFLEYVKENNLLKQKIEYRSFDLTKKEKEQILKLFSI